MTVTVKINTLAQRCSAEGIIGSNIRPHHFSADRECEVISQGIAPNNGRPYAWYAVKVFASIVFVTDRDIRAK